MEIDIHLSSFSLQRVLHSCLPPLLTSTLCVSHSCTLLDSHKYHCHAVGLCEDYLKLLHVCVCEHIWRGICFYVNISLEKKKKRVATAYHEFNSSAKHRRCLRRADLSSQPVQDFTEHLYLKSYLYPDITKTCLCMKTLFFIFILKSGV